MCRAFVVIALVTLFYLEGTVCFKFSITRDLTNLRELKKSSWINVEVNRAVDDESNDDITVKFEIPKTVVHSDAFVFFSNDDKEILQVNFNGTIQGKFYSTPHKFEKEMKGDETTQTEMETSTLLSGKFPGTWLPKKCNKISGAILGPDGQYYNYYKIQNFRISLPDLMVVEEYKSF